MRSAIGGPSPERAHAGPPQTAEEYLQRVRYEAMRCPQVLRVEISPSKMMMAAGAVDRHYLL